MFFFKPKNFSLCRLLGPQIMLNRFKNRDSPQTVQSVTVGGVTNIERSVKNKIKPGRLPRYVYCMYTRPNDSRGSCLRQHRKLAYMDNREISSFVVASERTRHVRTGSRFRPWISSVVLNAPRHKMQLERYQWSPDSLLPSLVYSQLQHHIYEEDITTSSLRGINTVSSQCFFSRAFF